MNKLITIDRQYLSGDEENAPGWACIVCLWKTGNAESGSADDERIIRYKKDAIAWAKKHHSDARISYCTDCTRKPKTA